MEQGVSVLDCLEKSLTIGSSTVEWFPSSSASTAGGIGCAETAASPTAPCGCGASQAGQLGLVSASAVPFFARRQNAQPRVAPWPLTPAAALRCLGDKKVCA
jgi:hypothetical protein